MRDIVRDPDTGKPALVVTSYEVIEMEVFEQGVETAQADYDQLFEQIKELTAKFQASESRLGEAKSEFARAQEVVADTAPGSDVDSGEGGTSGQVEAEAIGHIEIAQLA